MDGRTCKEISYNPKLYDESIKELLNYKDISWSYLDENLIEYLYKEKLVKKDYNDNELCKSIVQWLSNLNEEDSKAYYPINHVRFGVDTSLYDDFLQIVYKFPDVIHEYNKICGDEEIRKVAKSDAFIEINVKGYSDNDVKELSFEIAEYVVTLLNIAGFIEHNLFLNISIGNINKCYVYDSFIEQIDSKCIAFDSDTSNQIPLTIDNWNDNIKYNKKIMSILYRYANRNKLSEMENSILLSLRLIGRAISSKDKSISMILSISAIEALLESKKETKIKEKISTRCSKIISKCNDDFHENKKIIKNIYNIRSQIVHGEKYNVSKYEKQQVICLSIEVLYYVSQHFDEIKDFYNGSCHKAIAYFIDKKIPFY